MDRERAIENLEMISGCDWQQAERFLDGFPDLTIEDALREVTGTGAEVPLAARLELVEDALTRGVVSQARLDS